MMALPNQVAKIDTEHSHRGMLRPATTKSVSECDARADRTPIPTIATTYSPTPSRINVSDDT